MEAQRFRSVLWHGGALGRDIEIHGVVDAVSAAVEYRPAAIVVDEPELGLHPYAITMFASLVKQASIETQVILSTQSALLLDHFHPEDVLVAERVDNGTDLRRLDSSQLSDWLEDYGLGQLWEKNEFGGRPRR